ncbi:MAG: hypothetical protein SV760_05040 [Halobacteria archaeon]|nr:hypothetical protein [Halobacteria archaeon]
MELELSQEAKVQMGIALVVGLVFGAVVGVSAGSSVLSGTATERHCASDSSCVVLSQGAGYNVVLKYYDDGEKVGQSESMSSGLVYELNDVDKSVDTIKISADALGICGGVYRTFDSIEPGDYPVKITVGGAICTKSASIDKGYSP